MVVQSGNILVQNNMGKSFKNKKKNARSYSQIKSNESLEYEKNHYKMDTKFKDSLDFQIEEHEKNETYKVMDVSQSKKNSIELKKIQVDSDIIKTKRKNLKYFNRNHNKLDQNQLLLNPTLQSFSKIALKDKKLNNIYNKNLKIESQSNELNIENNEKNQNNETNDMNENTIQLLSIDHLEMQAHQFKKEYSLQLKHYQESDLYLSPVLSFIFSNLPPQAHLHVLQQISKNRDEKHMHILDSAQELQSLYNIWLDNIGSSLPTFETCIYHNKDTSLKNDPKKLDKSPMVSSLLIEIIQSLEDSVMRNVLFQLFKEWIHYEMDKTFQLKSFNTDYSQELKVFSNLNKQLLTIFKIQNKKIENAASQEIKKSKENILLNLFRMLALSYYFSHYRSIRFSYFVLKMKPSYLNDLTSDYLSTITDVDLNSISILKLLKIENTWIDQEIELLRDLMNQERELKFKNCILDIKDYCRELKCILQDFLSTSTKKLFPGYYKEVSNQLENVIEKWKLESKFSNQKKEVDTISNLSIESSVSIKSQEDEIFQEELEIAFSENNINILEEGFEIPSSEKEEITLSNINLEINESYETVSNKSQNLNSESTTVQISSIDNELKHNYDSTNQKEDISSVQVAETLFGYCAAFNSSQGCPNEASCPYIHKVIPDDIKLEMKHQEVHNFTQESEIIAYSDNIFQSIPIGLPFNPFIQFPDMNPQIDPFSSHFIPPLIDVNHLYTLITNQYSVIYQLQQKNIKLESDMKDLKMKVEELEKRFES